MSVTNEQSAYNDEKRTDRRKKQGTVKAKFFNGNLACIRGDTTWRVNDLNESHKIVKCPVCGAANDIQEAKKRAT